MKTETYTSFRGFPAKRAPGNFWCYPTVACLHWKDLKGSEQKVLDCILRHTWGFNKTKDRISLSQLEHGVGQIHHGAGLSKKQIIRALRSLEAKGFITSVKSSQTNEYSLVIEVHQEQGTKGNKDSVLTSPVTSDKTKQDSGIKSIHTIDTSIENTIETMYTFFSGRIHSDGKLTQQARKNMTDRLNEYHRMELVTAIKNVSENDFWGEIAQKNTPAWFFASEERIATFLALGPHKWPETQNDKSDRKAQ